jgi:hypothetical protein
MRVEQIATATLVLMFVGAMLLISNLFVANRWTATVPGHQSAGYRLAVPR